MNYLVKFEELLGGVGQLAQCQGRVEVDLPAEGGDDLLAVVAVGEDAAGGDQAVDGVADGADQNPKKREESRLYVFIVQYLQLRK